MLKDKDNELTCAEGKGELWLGFVNANQHPYGRAFIEAAVLVGRALDEGKTPKEACNVAFGLGLRPFGAAAAVNVVSKCHVRGEELRRWLLDD